MVKVIADADAVDETANDLNNTDVKVSKDARRSLAYFWDYYKWFVIIPLVIVLIIVSLAVSLVNENKVTYLTVAMVNVSCECDDLFSEYESVVEEDIRVNYDYLHPKMTDNYYVDSEEVNASVQKLQGNIISGRVDVICTNMRAIDDYSESNIWRDLRDVLGEDFVSQHSDSIYYIQDIPIGLNIEESDVLLSAYSISDEEHYLVFPNNTHKLDAIRDFTFYLYQ